MNRPPHLRLIGGAEHRLPARRRRRRGTHAENLAAATVVALKDAREDLEACHRALNGAFDRYIDLETKLRRLSGEEC